MTRWLAIALTAPIGVLGSALVALAIAIAHPSTPRRQASGAVLVVASALVNARWSLVLLMTGGHS